MPKVITLYPKVDVYCTELDTMFACVKDSVDDNKYLATVSLPPNTGDSDMIYNFEAYANEVATGLTVQVIVGYEIIYDYHKIHCIHVDNEYLEYHGGQITFTISFEDCTTGDCPTIVLVDLPTELYNKGLYEYIVGDVGEFWSSELRPGTDLYLCSYDETSGVWKFDKKVRDFVQLIPSCAANNFFITSKGDLYISTRSGKGVYFNDKATNTITKITSFGTESINSWIEDLSGNIYCITNSSRAYYVKNTTATQILSSDAQGSLHLLELQGAVYLAAGIGLKLYKLNEDNTPTTISSTFIGSVFQEIDSSSFYVGHYNINSANATGISYVKNGVVTTLIPSGLNWNFYKTSKGIIYVFNNTDGIYMLDGNTATCISSVDTGYKKVFETSKGVVYLYDQGQGLIALENDQVISILSSDSPDTMFETINGNVYFTNEWTHEYGLYHIDPSYNVTQIIPDGKTWSIVFKSSHDEIFVGSTNSDGVYKLDGCSATLVKENGQGSIYFRERHGKVYVSSDEYHMKGQFVWNRSTQTFELDPNADPNFGGVSFGIGPKVYAENKYIINYQGWRNRHHYGPCTANEPWGSDSVKLWYDGQLIFEAPTEKNGWRFESSPAAVIYLRDSFYVKALIAY